MSASSRGVKVSVNTSRKRSASRECDDDIDAMKPNRKSPRSSPRIMEKKAAPTSGADAPTRRSPRIFGTSYNASYTMLSRSLPASALASKFKAMPRPSERIRSRYLDRLHIAPPKTPTTETHSSSDTVPIRIVSNRRSQEYQWQLSEDEEEEEEEGDIDESNAQDFFAFELEDEPEVAESSSRRSKLPEKGTNSRSSADSAVSSSSTTSSSAGRVPIAVPKSRSSLVDSVKVSGGSRRFTAPSSSGIRMVPSSFVPPHELIQRGWGDRGSLGVPHRFRRKRPSQSPS